MYMLYILYYSYLHYSCMYCVCVFCAFPRVNHWASDSHIRMVPLNSLATGQVTRRWRSTRIPERSESPGGRGCSRAPEAWAEAAGTGRNPCPSSALALDTSPAPTPLRREHQASARSQWQVVAERPSETCSPFLMTIFIILMAPPLARARKSLSSDVAEETRYKADESTLRIEWWRCGMVEPENLRTSTSGRTFECRFETRDPTELDNLRPVCPPADYKLKKSRLLAKG